MLNLNESKKDLELRYREKIKILVRDCIGVYIR
jgi:hypothetical protein